MLELTTSLVNDLQKNAKVVSIDGYEDVPVNDEKALQKAVANQPISVAIEAGGRDFQLYQSVSSVFNGVVSFWHCLKPLLNKRPCSATLLCIAS